MIRILISYTLFLLLPAIGLMGQNAYFPKKVHHAYRVGVAPEIDGAFNDEAWQDGTWDGDFTQYYPYADRPPTQQTEFRVAFDDMNLYVAVKAFDSAPDSITTRMSRRDYSDGDLVFIIFDSYHDLRSGFTFGVSSAGARFDHTSSNNWDSQDASWDPIWQARTMIHDWGWGAEIKIPFTQLRFKKNAEDVWGFDVARLLFRKEEVSYWHPIPRTAPGQIQALGELDGLQGIEPRKQLDLTPYAVSSVKTYEPEEGNPYADGTDPGFNVGLDGKIGVTNNLTLDFTLNPDFGQVEADPSEVNLTAYETFFQEKRPFFIEGASITSFNVGLGDGDVGNDNLFYSRRIGRKPHREPDLADNEYARVPIFTRILGATKLTGKTENGLSIGIVEALTSDTRAKIDNNGEERQETVEPLTNYSLARLQKDFNQGMTIIGGAVTNTIRKLDGTDLDDLHKNATTAGLDFTQYFKERYYSVDASLYLSNVQGTAEAISNTQLSSARYFQRPDADYLIYDSTLTSLSGLGGKLEFGRLGGDWNFQFMNIIKSPGIEFNDMGYQREADNILNVFWTGYNFSEPFSIFRNLYINNDVYLSSDFGGNITSFGYEYNANASFTNFWSSSVGGGFNFHSVSNGILRGGPSMHLPNTARIYCSFSTDDRKIFSAAFMGYTRWGMEKYFSITSLNLTLTIRPLNSLNLSLTPSYSPSFQELQYITEEEMNGEARYIFGYIDQDVLSMSIRLNYTIIPDLTIQYWGQPFIASGDYKDFKMITDPKADRFSDRYYTYATDQISLNDDYFEVYENADLVPDYGFDNPNFNVNEWLSNLVIRWEFLPGSVGYLVWSQTRDYYNSAGEFEVWDNMNNLFTDKKATNTFLVKFSYRFGLR